MSVVIECSRCSANARIGLEGNSAWAPLAHSAVPAWADPGESAIAVILPEGWKATHTGVRVEA